MKISIDTKEDSHEEIRKAIRMLSSLVGEDARTNQPDMFSDSDPSPPESGNAFANMFGGDKPAEPSSDSSEPETETSDSDEDKDSPQIMEY